MQVSVMRKPHNFIVLGKILHEHELETTKRAPY